MTLICDSSHRYFKDGKEIPGCTRVLDMSGIADYGMVRADVLERKSEIGRLTHTACHYFDEGNLDWSSVPESVKPKVDAWAKFSQSEAFKPFPDRIEYQTAAEVNGMAYGCRIDRAGLMRGRPAILELKTTAQIMPAHGIQLAGYGLAIAHTSETPEAPLSHLARFLRWERYAVQLKEDGSFRLVAFTEKNDASVFLWALGIAWWKMSKGAKIREIEE